MARKKKSIPSKSYFKRLFRWCILLTIIAVVGGIYYAFQPEDKQEVIQVKVLEIVDLIREHKAAPRELRDILNVLVEFFPAGRGLIVNPGTLEADQSYLYAGLPKREGVILLKNEGYIVGYDENTKNPAWVAYKLTKGMHSTVERPPKFIEDRRTRSRIEHEDYTGTGYDRGHMAPNFGIGTVYGPEAQNQTFLMSNIIPQTPELNRGPWKALEQSIANDYTQRFDEVWVITGPIYDGTIRRLKSGIYIPSHCFKIVVDNYDGGMRCLGFVFPQNIDGDVSYKDYLASVDQVEQLTGMDFFSMISDEAEEIIENKIALRVW